MKARDVFIDQQYCSLECKATTIFKLAVEVHTSLSVRQEPPSSISS